MKRVVIAGAGPVGLSLALGLARYGIESTVIERKHELDPHSRAIVLWPRTLEILRQWDVLERFFAATSRRNAFSVYAAENGERLASVDFTCISAQTDLPYVLVMPQDRTEHLLLDAVRSTGMVEVLFDTEIVSCRDLEDRVHVVAQRLDGSRFVLESEYLVGADGARGIVRNAIGFDLEGKTYPLRTLIADVTVTDQRDALPSPRLSIAQPHPLGAIRYDEHAWRVVAVFPQDEIHEDDDLHALLAPRVELLLGPGTFETVWVSLFRTHARRVPRFRLGRVVLAGDAAHLNSPAGGQGMNSGIADAHNLAWKLARVLGGGDAESLLESYDLERRGAVAENIEHFTDMLTRVAMLPAEMRLAAIRALEAALRAPGGERAAARRMAMLDIPYHRSTLFDSVAERVGRRAPDALIGSTRLYQHMEREPLLFVYQAPSDEPIDEAALRQAVDGIPDLRLLVVDGGIDGNRAIGRLWGASRSFAALIRPDHYVGWLERSWTPESLRTGVCRALGVNA